MSETGKLEVTSTSVPTAIDEWLNNWDNCEVNIW